MVERRSNPIDRCPSEIKDIIARVVVSKMIKRVIDSTKYTDPRKEGGAE